MPRKPVRSSQRVIVARSVVPNGTSFLENVGTALRTDKDGWVWVELDRFPGDPVPFRSRELDPLRGPQSDELPFPVG
jgi:hypothetical protein